MHRHNVFIQKVFADKRGRIVLMQKPNLPLIIWLVCVIANKFVEAKTPTAILHEIGTTALVVWAVQEVAWGVNYFRRALGLVVLVWMLIGLFG